MPKIIDVTGLILRGAHQSLRATRMAVEEMIPACADLDAAGDSAQVGQVVLELE